MTDTRERNRQSAERQSTGLQSDGRIGADAIAPAPARAPLS